MDKELEEIIKSFMAYLEAYEQNNGVFVKLFRSHGFRSNQLNAEIEKNFGSAESDNQDKAA